MATALMFINGNAAFLDDDGRQIPEMQIHGWAGLHLFIERFPNGDVQMPGGRLPLNYVSLVLNQIRKPEVSNGPVLGAD